MPEDFAGGKQIKGGEVWEVICFRGDQARENAYKKPETPQTYMTLGGRCLGESIQKAGNFANLYASGVIKLGGKADKSLKLRKLI